jgi:hypothetical protein
MCLLVTPGGSARAWRTYSCVPRPLVDARSRPKTHAQVAIS